MSFDWKDYLLFAQEMCGKSNGGNACQETKMRCAISRAYYSAFCNARNFLNENGVKIPDDANIHNAVKREFSDSKDKLYKEIGVNLDRLRLSRNKADYDNVFYEKGRIVRNLSSEANKSISYSEIVLRKLNELRTDGSISQAK